MSLSSFFTSVPATIQLTEPHCVLPSYQYRYRCASLRFSPDASGNRQRAAFGPAISHTAITMRYVFVMPLPFLLHVVIKSSVFRSVIRSARRGVLSSHLLCFVTLKRLGYGSDLFITHEELCHKLYAANQLSRINRQIRNFKSFIVVHLD